MAPGSCVHGCSHKIGLAEPKKSPHKVPFCSAKTYLLGGFSGVLGATTVTICVHSFHYFHTLVFAVDFVVLVVQ